MTTELYQTASTYLAKSWGLHDKTEAAKLLESLAPINDCECLTHSTLRFTYATLDATFKANVAVLGPLLG